VIACTMHCLLQKFVQHSLIFLPFLFPMRRALLFLPILVTCGTNSRCSITVFQVFKFATCAFDQNRPHENRTITIASSYSLRIMSPRYAPFCKTPIPITRQNLGHTVCVAIVSLALYFVLPGSKDGNTIDSRSYGTILLDCYEVYCFVACFGYHQSSSSEP